MTKAPILIVFLVLYLQSCYPSRPSTSSSSSGSEPINLRDSSTQRLLNDGSLLRDDEGRYRPVYTEFDGEICSFSQFNLIRLIGDGSAGEVYQAQHKRSGTYVAIKFMRPKRHQCSGARAEEVVLSRVNHPNIPKYMCTFMDGDIVGLVMEWIQGTELFAIIGRRSLSRDMVQLIMRQLIDTLGYLHKRHLIHGDIKPENMLITNGGRLYVVDYDHARFSNGPIGGRLGTPCNMAPELLKEEDFDDGVDYFAAGMVLFEMYTGKHPRGEVSTREEALNRAHRKIPKVGDPEIDDLVEHLTRANPAKRWSYANGKYRKIIGHPFISEPSSVERVESVDSLMDFSSV